MKVNKVKTTLLVGVILSLFVVGAMAVQPLKTDSVTPFFTLVAKTNGGGVRPDYLNFFKQHIAKIGINLEVIVQDWPTFVGELIVFRDFDVCYVGLTGGGADPDFTGVYDENGSLNLFGYDETMDWDDTLVIGDRTGWGLNEWYMKKGTLIMPPDSEARVAHYWEWEDYMMDKICPLLPTYAPEGYIAQWATLDGYNYTDGVLQSWGKMDFSAAHDGQISTDELVITDAAWSDLNPLFQDDTSSSFISGAVLDPLIQYDADLSAWPMLAESYVMENDTTILVTARDGIYWADDPDGVGDNEPFTIKDVYFTFYAWKTVSNDVHLFDWIEDMEFVGDDSLRIFIDGDISTYENDPYAPFLPSLWTNMLPEFYLNQTQDVNGYPDVTHPSWNTYATNAFGTGAFEIYDFTEGVETTLKLRADCWHLNDAVTSDPALNWEERFGYAAGFTPMNYLRIRIIPDLQTSLLEFEAGKVDIVGVTTYPDKRDEYALNPEFEIQSDTLFSYGFFGYNMRETRGVIGERDPCPGDDTLSIGLAVRKAMSYACNRVEINQVIHRGEYIITDWPIYPKMGIWCNPNIIRYNFDLDKAREYMAKAGYGTIVPTTTTPGFALIITIASLFAVASASFLIIKKRR